MRILIALLSIMSLGIAGVISSSFKINKKIPGVLRVSNNGRFLVQSDGKPFFWLGDTGWEFTTINGQTYEQTYDLLADTIFYSRHPQRTGQQIPKSDRIGISEWSAIRREMYISNCGL